MHSVLGYSPTGLAIAHQMVGLPLAQPPDPHLDLPPIQSCSAAKRRPTGSS